VTSCHSPQGKVYVGTTWISFLVGFTHPDAAQYTYKLLQIDFFSVE